MWLASGLNMPSGVAVKEGALYVAEVNRIWRYDAIGSHLPKPPAPVLVSDKYPSDRHHGWKFARFGPDGWLYVQEARLATCASASLRMPRSPA